jgi:hypothetical protein
LLGLFFGSEDGGDMFLRKVFTFNGLHGVISQKIQLFTLQYVSKACVYKEATVSVNISFYLLKQHSSVRKAFPIIITDQLSTFYLHRSFR